MKSVTLGGNSLYTNNCLIMSSLKPGKKIYAFCISMVFPKGVSYLILIFQVWYFYTSVVQLTDIKYACYQCV